MKPAIEQREGWAIVRLPGATSADDLRDALSVTATDRRQRVALITGDVEGITAWSDEDTRWLWRGLPLPVVSAFPGELTGDGAHVALASDIRICGEDAALTVPTCGAHQSQRLADLAGRHDIPTPGARLDAAALLDRGLVSRVAANVQAEAERLCGLIASRGPFATRLAKEALWRGLHLPFEQALRFETDLTLLLQTTKDRAEGVRAFVEKRSPHFEGD